MHKFVKSAFVAAALAAACFVSTPNVAAQSAPTLRVVTEDPTLPSELYYGDIKVKPLRLRPGTNQPITIDDSDFFVQQQYIDFLSRFPETSGFDSWMGVFTRCNGDSQCIRNMRIEVSGSFFRSEEFQIKGYYVYRFYKAALGRLPLYTEFMPDMRFVTATTPEERDAKKIQFMNAFVQRPEFAGIYGAMSNADYVNALMSRNQISLANRQQLIDDLNANRKTRADVLRVVVESAEIFNKEYNGAFVAMQYFGYLRRDPETTGYNDWMRVINANPQDYKTMVNGFVNSIEYRNRF